MLYFVSGGALRTDKPAIWLPFYKPTAYLHSKYQLVYHVMKTVLFIF